MRPRTQQIGGEQALSSGGGDEREEGTRVTDERLYQLAEEHEFPLLVTMEPDVDRNA